MKTTNQPSYIRDGRAPIPQKDTTSKVMSLIRAKNTKPEMTLRKALFANGLSGYRLHWKKIPGKPDISYPGIKLAIFVHGCFWHRCPNCNPPFPKSHKRFWKQKFEKNVERDKRNSQDLEKQGWKVVTIWECEIKDDLQNCVDIIRIFKLKY
ncbi:MAG: very short patch repair endonuclease [Anaerolineales bacterium]|nr:very short patch repair endonuclease [Anaerolineales bacterium]